MSKDPSSCSGSVTTSRDFFNRPSSTSPLSAVGLLRGRSGIVSCFPPTKRRRVRPRLIGKLDLRLVAAVAVSAMVGRLALWRLAAMVGRLLDRRINSGLLRGRSFLPPAKRVNFTLKFCLFSFLNGTVSRYGYFFEGLNILISNVCFCADGFQGLSKAFKYHLKLLTFCLLLRNYLIILKKLTKTFSEFTSLLLVHVL